MLVLFASCYLFNEFALKHKFVNRSKNYLKNGINNRRKNLIFLSVSLLIKFMYDFIGNKINKIYLYFYFHKHTSFYKK